MFKPSQLWPQNLLEIPCCDAAIWIVGLVAIPSACLVVPSLLSGMVKPWAVNEESAQKQQESGF